MNRPFAPVKHRERLYQDIVEQIQQMIVGGQLRPGDRLPPERDLAGRFGVSRTAVREAIKSLAEKGLVDVQVGRGTFVTSPTSEQIADTMTLLLSVERNSVAHLQEAREQVEVPIAALAAERRTAEHLAHLATLLAQMEGNVHDAVAFVEADTAFHTVLAEATGNPVLVVLSRVLMSLIGEERRFAVGKREQHAAALAAHARILDAVERGDAGSAAAEMRSHLEHVGRFMAEAPAA